MQILKLTKAHEKHKKGLHKQIVITLIFMYKTLYKQMNTQFTCLQIIQETNKGICRYLKLTKEPEIKGGSICE